MKVIWNYLAGLKAYVSCDVFTTMTRNVLNRNYFTYLYIYTIHYFFFAVEFYEVTV